MFKKILIANRGDQRQGRAAAKLNCMAREAYAGYLTAKVNYVKKTLIANRSDQRQGRAAAKLNGMAREACAGYFTAKVNYV